MNRARLVRFHIHFAAAAVLAMAAQGPAAAQQTTIGFAAPLSGPYEALGLQMSNGAQAAASDRQSEIIVEDSACTAEGGGAVAQRFVEARVAVVAGFLCTEAIEAALPILAKAGIPVVATGVRSGGLTDRRDKTGWPVVRYAPRADAEVRAAADILGKRWREAFFAIIDDGTIYSRELAEGFRLAVEEQGLKPAFIDTFRPQLENQVGLVGRLRRSGATHVLAAGDRADLAIIGRDAAALGYDLVIAGGEVLRSASDETDLAEGTLMIGLPEWSEIADPAVVAAFTERGVVPDGYVLPAYASVEVAVQAVEAARTAGVPVFDILQSEEFATVLGPVGFDDKGDRTDNPYRLFRYDGSRFVEVTD